MPAVPAIVPQAVSVEHNPTPAEDDSWRFFVVQLEDWAGRRLGDLDATQFRELRDSPLLARIAENPQSFPEYLQALAAAVRQREKSQVQGPESEPRNQEPAPPPKESEVIAPSAQTPFLDLVKGGQLREVGLELPPSILVGDWQRVGHALGEAENLLRWAFADWWHHAELHQYGDRKKMVEAENWSGPGLQALMNASWVAKSIPPERRKRQLSFRHHAEVASLPVSEADELLEWCLPDGAKKPRTVRELRQEIARRIALNGEDAGVTAKPARAPKRESSGASMGEEQAMKNSAPFPEEDHEDQDESAAGIDPLVSPPPAQSRYDVLLQVLRGLRDDPPDVNAVVNLSVAGDLTTLEPTRVFFGTFYARLKARFVQSSPPQNFAAANP
jgi:hypothetical protein